MMKTPEEIQGLIAEIQTSSISFENEVDQINQLLSGWREEIILEASSCVCDSLPSLFEFATKALDNIANSCRYINSGNASHLSKSIEGSAKRNAEFIRNHYR